MFYLLLEESEEEKQFKSFDYFDDCLEFLIRTFEQTLTSAVGPDDLVTYTCNELFEFVEKKPGLLLLEYDADLNMYSPRSKEWLRACLYTFLEDRTTSIL